MIPIDNGLANPYHKVCASAGAQRDIQGMGGEQLSHKPSKLAAILCLAAFFCFGVPQLFAGENCFCLADSACTNGYCSVFPTADCARREITLACSGAYVLRVELDCDGEFCGGCQSCASLWKLSGDRKQLVLSCETNGCTVNACENSCSAILSADDKYVLYVCKLPCPGAANDCGECSTTCEAVACLYSETTSTPCTP